MEGDRVTYTSNAKLTPYAQKLRKEMTKEERHLWYDFLKHLDVSVNRQKTLGPYIVDFYCDKAKLVIELDGSQHFEETGAAKDKRRDQALSEEGYTVLRYANSEVNGNFRGYVRIFLPIFRREPSIWGKTALIRLALAGDAQATFPRGEGFRKRLKL